jgi:hypothetical protein
MERIVDIIERLIVGDDAPVKPVKTQVSLTQKIRLLLFKDVSAHTDGDRKKKQEVYEIEKAVLRVGNLLRLGLGEAGAKIISCNMKDGEMLYEAGGRLVHGIYSLCVRVRVSVCIYRSQRYRVYSVYTNV